MYVRCICRTSIIANPRFAAAFCFYNLSSILNGLVYFDQFALIPPLHLCLVVLGILVLLGGVWVVSIQSGEADAGSDVSDEEEVMLEGVHAETYFADSPTSTNGANGSQTLEWGTRSEPVIPTQSQTSGLGLDFGLNQPLLPASTISIPDAPLSPSSIQSRRKRPTLEGLTVSTRRHQQRGTSHTHIELSPPLPNRSAVSALAGAGFQIGLAATSPGFAIVPRERRRRVSTLVGRPPSGDVGEDAVPDFGTSRRRTVSEGDVRRDLDGMEESVEEPSTSHSTGKQGARSRWQWLRRALGRGA